MKTAYKILWVDDDPSSVDTDQEDVKDFLEEFGIRADIDFVEAPADGSIKTRLEHHLKDPELDLLMVDFNMDGLKGDQLVKLIRGTDHIYLPVIFYSSSSVDDLMDAVRLAEIDGVYIANRQFFINKVKDVVRSLLVKEQTVKQVRGLLMEGVSEIDTQFHEIFFKVWENLDADKLSQIEQYLRGILQKRVESSTAKAECLPTDTTQLGTHLKENFLTASYDTYTRWRLTMKALELIDHPEKDRQKLKEFANGADGQTSLNSLRNDYAHKSRKILSTEHSVERCIEIRKALRTHSANIDSILGTE